jgi:hypothetical protein
MAMKTKKQATPATDADPLSSDDEASSTKNGVGDQRKFVSRGNKRISRVADKELKASKKGAAILSSSQIRPPRRAKHAPESDASEDKKRKVEDDLSEMSDDMGQLFGPSSQRERKKQYTYGASSQSNARSSQNAKAPTTIQQFGKNKTDKGENRL